LGVKKTKRKQKTFLGRGQRATAGREEISMQLEEKRKVGNADFQRLLEKGGSEGGKTIEFTG